MQTIIMTKGIPASGKSTWALNEMQRNPGRFKRVNKDILRDLIDNGLFSEKNETFICKIRDTIVENALIKGFDVIVDDTNFGDKHWNAMCQIAQSVGDVKVVEKFFEVTLKEALDRNSKRSNNVSNEVIHNMYEKYIKNKKLDIREEYFPKPIKNMEDKFEEYYNFNFELFPNKELAIIIDIDGTVALNGDRSVFDLSKVIDDEPYVDVCAIIENLPYKKIFVSGREDKCKEDTILWIKNYITEDFEIYMRKTNDFRKDYIIKEEIYKKFIEPKYGIVAVFDDRPQVCKMWRKNNLTCFQLNHLDF